MAHPHDCVFLGANFLELRNCDVRRAHLLKLSECLVGAYCVALRPPKRNLLVRVTFCIPPKSTVGALLVSLFGQSLPEGEYTEFDVHLQYTVVHAANRKLFFRTKPPPLRQRSVLPFRA